MRFDKLAPGYRVDQAERVLKNVLRVLARGGTPTAGRAIPDDDALVIGTGRGLHLAVLFLDISGFSGRPSGTHAEQHAMLQVLKVFFSEMVRIAADYGGTVEKNTGDGLMAYFERDVLSGVSASQRAVAAALTMMHANTTIVTPVLVELGRDPITFRVGIDYGPVTVARLGVARQFNANVAIGTPANIASKILARAGPGQIVIGEAVALELPVSWHRYIYEHGPSGFEYVDTRSAYPLYLYEGRWVR